MNKDKRNNIQLLGTLNNADESGIIANANQIYDANEDKSTQDVSKEHAERIKDLEDKENSMQTTLENITKTGEASAASNVTYNHNDSKIDATNVQQAVDEISTKTVFDISAYHATGGTLATYADLTAALGTNGANIPQSLQKGGMSVKFVQSSDNKYVQYRCMAQNFTTDVTQWQGVDDEPTTGSDNLVKSGGISSAISSIAYTKSLSAQKTEEDKKLKGNGLKETDENYTLLKYSVTPGDIIKVHLNKDGNNVCQFQRGYSIPSGGTNSDLIGTVYQNACYGLIVVPEEASWLIVSQLKTNSSNYVEKVVSADNNPTSNSDNLVRSKGVFNSFNNGLILQRSGNTGISFNRDGGITLKSTGFTLYYNGTIYNIFGNSDKIITPSFPTGFPNFFVYIDQTQLINTSINWDEVNIIRPTNYHDLQATWIMLCCWHYTYKYIQPIGLLKPFSEYSYDKGLVEQEYAAYFTSSTKPSFDLSNFNSAGKVIVTLPSGNQAMRLYYRGQKNTYAYEHVLGNNRVFEVTNLKQLAYNVNDNTIEVVDIVGSSGKDYITLLSVCGNSIDGAFLGYYIEQIRLEEDNNFSFIDNCMYDTSVSLNTLNESTFDYFITENVIDGLNRGRATFIGLLKYNSGTIDLSVTNLPDNFSYLFSTGKVVYKYGNNTLIDTTNGYSSGWKTKPENINVINNGSIYFSIAFKKNDESAISDSEYDTILSSFAYNATFKYNSKYVTNESTDIIARYNKFSELAKRENILKNSDLKLMFFSDLHANIKALKRIIQLVNNWGNKVDFVIDGGDDVNGYLSDNTISDYNSTITALDRPIIRAVGNHDAWSTNYWTWASEQEIYNAITSPTVTLLNSKGATVIQPSDAGETYKNYYYVDTTKIRIIVILSLTFNGTNRFFDNTQKEWFTQVLEDARENNKAVICVNHGPLGPDTCIQIDSNWSSWKKWNTREDTQHIDVTAVSEIDTFINNGGKFICWLSGHSHADYLLRTNSENSQLCFVTSTANNTKVADGMIADNPFFTEYDLFNYIGIDINNGLLKVWRIGNNNNAALQVHNYFCWDFINHKFITNN